MNNKPVTDSIRLFKTLARVARFHSDPEVGLVAGIRSAELLMPFFREHFARVRGEPCTDTHLRDLASTTSKTLACYRTGDGLSRPRQAARLIAIEVLDRGVVLTEDDVSTLLRNSATTMQERREPDLQDGDRVYPFKVFIGLAPLRIVFSLRRGRHDVNMDVQSARALSDALSEKAARLERYEQDVRRSN